MTSLSGMRVLIVEDEYLVALDLAICLREAGAHVIGPAGSIRDAFAHIRDANGLGAAVLDVNVLNEKIFPVADALADRGVPFVFTTGYDASVIPERHRDVRRIEKPADSSQVVHALLALTAAPAA